MKRAWLILALVPWLTAGCNTSRMWAYGFKTKTTPERAPDLAGYQPPQATKDTNGGVVLEYDAAQYHVRIFGSPDDESKWRLVRLTNAIPSAQLASISNPEFGGVKFSCPPASNELAFVQVGKTLPMLQRELAGGTFVYPAYECIQYHDGWTWYVPPRQAGETAKEALLAEAIHTSSTQDVVAKIALTPVLLVVDTALVAFSPVLIAVALFGDF